MKFRRRFQCFAGLRHELAIARENIFNGIKFAVALVKLFHLGEIERTRTAPPEYNRLVAAFVHDAVAVESARNGKGRGFGGE